MMRKEVDPIDEEIKSIEAEFALLHRDKQEFEECEKDCRDVSVSIQ